MLLQPNAVFATLFLFGISRAQDILCNPNEQHLTCGPDCSPTCQDQSGETCNNTEPCVDDCFCVKGYIREGPGGRCVQSCKDVQICEKDQHEEFTTCVPFACPEGKFCPAVCQSGCKCVDGYVKNNEGQCIHASKPTKPTKPINRRDCTKKNEYYKKRGSSCPATCSEPKKTCTNDVPTAGCYCGYFYIRDDITLECVRKGKCSTTPTTSTITTTSTTPIVQ